MNRSIIICLVVISLAAMVAAQYGGGYRPQYESHEKRFISLPVPHLRINLDKLTLPLPNLMSLFPSFQTVRSSHYDDDDEEHY